MFITQLMTTDRPDAFHLNLNRRYPIVYGMKWCIAAAVLLLLGAILRRLFFQDARAPEKTTGLLVLSPESQAVYQLVSQAVETEATILGVSLNDAFEERDLQRHDIAWRLVQLSGREWEKLEVTLRALYEIISARLPLAQGVVSLRSVTASHFCAPSMGELVRMHELLDQLVFSSRLRFQLQIRLLRRATEILSTEFRKTCRYAEHTNDRSPEVWNRLDLYFHDFDLISKKALVALRTLLLCLPPEGVSDLLASIRDKEKVRATVA